MVILLVLIGSVGAVLVLQARRGSLEDARDRTLSVANAFASAPGTVEALDGPHPTAILQPRAEAARKRTGVAFVVVYRPDGIRLTHPDPALIGKHVIGPYEEAARGKSFTKVITGSRGPAVDSIVPVFRPDGSVAGIVDVAITLESVNETVTRQLPVLLGAVAGALVLATAGSAWASRRLRRQTHGLGHVEMTRMYEHHDAVLHSVREGVLVLGGEGRLLLANDEARRLLGLAPDAEGRRVADLDLEPRMAELLASGRVASDEVLLSGDRLLAVNVRPTDRAGGPPGSVATLRDTTELRALSGRIEVAQERLGLLYDAGVRIGTTLDVVRTAEELAEVAVPRFADLVTVELLDPVLRGDEPTRAADMRRAANRGSPDAPLFPVGEPITWLPGTPMAVALEKGHAVLEADLGAAPGWQAQSPERARKVLEYGIRSLIAVPMRARGVVLGLVDFWRTDQRGPFDEEDLSFAEELVARAAVCVDNARRYTREHGVAVTLQRSLLPRELPEQDALEVAHRYLPARAGVGGDWFDVIPLPGARAALVVGDVVGHGLHAAATMGRLRTAVLNFSALDLPPDEILAHLDELVTRIDQDKAAEAETDPVTGATCLYAIYDPVGGRCTVATAGHPGPALVRPDGTVDFPEVPASPPLGLAEGLPVETAELDLAEGSHLVLFTDGLVEDRDRDIDTGLALLRDALTGRPGRHPEETCRAVIDAVLPPHPSDDVALLVARTRLLDPARVADWEVPRDPATVAPVRAACVRQLDVWGLEEVGFNTELILSELVTNAIRYGSEPIRVRLLCGRNLVCEVSDGSSTSPHLRKAATTDEGGRGLFLVARLAQRWGTRYTPQGKVIWSELSLRDGATEPGEDMADLLLEQWDDEAL
ncbi:SpoIIE family protein phosphatase/ATP-binding protein [Streptomyces sp. NTH33]|uniref:SpoIIE family protein phosphatase/ATP-binding protein n=1 Tax=Streptomyces sp. NTH33 TaxID=1735453 RepID=UPI0021AC0A9C|nr:SpoIIE family protein phosphatase/ATP-binding protein [Streptomyces sp. NTH33]